MPMTATLRAVEWWRKRRACRHSCRWKWYEPGLERLLHYHYVSVPASGVLEGIMSRLQGIPRRRRRSDPDHPRCEFDGAVSDILLR
jgi:hypothetical protein